MGLIDILHERVGCDYISSLRNPIYFPLLYAALNRIRADDYSMWQWQDTVQYITGSSVRFNSSQQALNYLMEFVNEK